MAKRTRAEDVTVSARSRALADAIITKRYPPKRWLVSFIYQRDTKGRFNKRGTRFTYLVRRKKKTPKLVEYAVNVNYRIKGQSNAISMQFSVMAPPGLTASEVQDIIIETIVNEGDSPDGTKVKIVDWKGGRVPHEIPWGKLAILADEPATRFRVSQSRSHR